MACGLCVPLCPTYRKSRNESDSPRGRVALMLALAKNDLPVSTSLESHLSLCLAHQLQRIRVYLRDRSRPVELFESVFKGIHKVHQRVAH